MTDKYIPYSLDGKMYDVPESESSEFEKMYPSATIEMHMDGKIYDVPLKDKDAFLKEYGSNVTYSFDKGYFDSASTDNTYYDRTSIIETIGNVSVDEENITSVLRNHPELVSGFLRIYGLGGLPAGATSVEVSDTPAETTGNVSMKDKYERKSPANTAVQNANNDNEEQQTSLYDIQQKYHIGDKPKDQLLEEELAKTEAITPEYVAVRDGERGVKIVRNK